MKKLIRKVMRSAGYDIVRWRQERPGHGFNAYHLSKLLQPGTVFDVGVGNGTHPLYEAFPNAVFVLVEPVREQEPIIRKIQDAYNCRVVYKAVGSTAGELELQVDLDDPEKSSFRTRTSLTSRQHTLAKRVVEVTTLDRILAENPDLPRPILVKLDTEGHEIEALKGATELLQQAEMVIAEVSIAERFEGGYRFEDMIGFMNERGYRFMDILSIARAEGELQPRHMDVVFKRT